VKGVFAGVHGDAANSSEGVAGIGIDLANFGWSSFCAEVCDFVCSVNNGAAEAVFATVHGDAANSSEGVAWIGIDLANFGWSSEGAVVCEFVCVVNNGAVEVVIATVHGNAASTFDPNSVNECSEGKSENGTDKNEQLHDTEGLYFRELMHFEKK
jgi:hypothetical protein